MKDIDNLNKVCEGLYPSLLGIKMTAVSAEAVTGEMKVTKSHLAPNGYLHAGSIVSLADTVCGNGCLINLPEGASGFTTIELKSNHLSTVTEGVVSCTATVVHKGRTTHVWDAEVKCTSSNKTLALFRCTQMILYPK